MQRCTISLRQNEVRIIIGRKDAEMKIQLNVPYAEKDAAKVAGAQWDAQNKKWYLWDQNKIDAVTRWLPDGDIYNLFVTKTLYIVKGWRTCWKCGQSIPVYAIGVDSFAAKGDDGTWHFNGHFTLINGIERYSYEANEKIARLTDGCLKLHYSKTVETKYLMNLCPSCGAPQGDNYLYEEIDSVFAPATIADAENLEIYRTPLAFDIGLKGSVFSMYADGKDTNKLIWEYARKSVHPSNRQI